MAPYTLILVASFAAVSLPRAVGRPFSPELLLQRACTNPGGHRICDPDGILSAAGAAAVLDAIERLESEVTTPCGAASLGPQVSVTLVQNMELQGTKEATARSFALTLHDTWEVGHAACQDGLVMLLSIGDRQLHMSTGAGLKRLVTDDHVQVIIARMRPLLRAGDVHAAIMLALSDVRDTLVAGENGDTPLGREVAQTAAAKRWGEWLATVLLWGASIVIVCLVGACWSFDSCALRQQQSEWEACKAKLIQLESLQRERAAAAAAAAAEASAEHDASTDGSRHRGGGGGGATGPVGDAPHVPLAAALTCCPICIEDFAPEPAAASAATRVTAITLPCRHRFHVACIDSWMGGQAKNTCPICRQRAFDAPRGTDATDAGAGGTDGGGGSSHRVAGAAWRAADRLDSIFILNRMHTRYPTYVTQDMMRMWEGDIHRGHMPLYTTAPSFIATFPLPSEHSSSRTGRSSGRSFGGGSSRGGGGGGGGW